MRAFAVTLVVKLGLCHENLDTRAVPSGNCLWSFQLIPHPSTAAVLLVHTGSNTADLARLDWECSQMQSTAIDSLLSGGSPRWYLENLTIKSQGHAFSCTSYTTHRKHTADPRHGKPLELTEIRSHFSSLRSAVSGEGLYVKTPHPELAFPSFLYQGTHKPISVLV